MEDLQPLRARSAGRAMGDAKARQSSPARQVSPKGLRRAPKAGAAPRDASRSPDPAWEP